MEVREVTSISLMNLKSSISGEIEKSVNTFLGLRLLYNINNKFNFSLGLNSLDISNRTLAKTDNGSFALAGDINESKVQAIFFDFGVEYFY